MTFAAALGSAWSVKPRMHSDSKASPVSWLNVARYPTVDAFREVSRMLDEETSADYLSEHVFYMSCICVTKHRLVSNAILLALAGGLCVVLSIVVRGGGR